MNKLIIFSSKWCGPCAELRMKTAKIPHVSYDIDVDRDLAIEYNVTAIPCLILEDSDGKELRRLLGVPSEETLQSLV